MSDFFYKKLEAYKLAKEFTIYVYSLLKRYPSYEQYALCDQLRRAVVSIPSNISQALGYIDEIELEAAETKAETLTRVLSGLRKTLSEKMNNKEG